MSKSELKTTIKPNLAISEPPLFKVVYLNDEVTTAEFVVQSLVDHFNYSQDTAMNVTMMVHHEGSAVVAVLPYEIAEQKELEVTHYARQSGFPLQVRVESTVI